MLSFRRVEPSKLETLRVFAERTFRIAFEADNEPVDFEQYCRENFTAENFAAQLRHPASEFWFGFWDDTLAAYLKLNFDQNPSGLADCRTVQVERLYVEPAFQGRRIGEKLLDLAFERAQLVQAEWIWLSVWQKNPPALRFYERCGYEIFGTEVFWVGEDPQTDWLVKKRVAILPQILSGP